MEHIGLQTDTLNPTAVRHSLNSLADQFAELSTLNNCLPPPGSDIGEQKERMEQHIVQFHEQLESLAEVVKDVEHLVDTSQEHIQELSAQEKQTLQENSNLIAEVKKYQLRGNFEFLCHRVCSSNLSVSIVDSEGGRHLRDTARNGLLGSLDRLQELRDTHEGQKCEFNREWAELRADIERQRQEEQPFLERVDQTQDLLLARLQGMLDHHPDLAETERDAINATVEYLQAERAYRGLDRDIVDAQLELRDLQNEVDGLLIQKTAMWKQHAHLEHNILENSRILDPDNGIILKHSLAYSNLPSRDEKKEKLDFVESRHNLQEVELAPKTATPLGAFKLRNIGLLRKSSKQTSVCMLPTIDLEGSVSAFISPLVRQQSSVEISPDKNDHREVTDNAHVQPEQETETSIQAEEQQGEPDPPCADVESKSPIQSGPTRNFGDNAKGHQTSMLTKIRKRMGVTSSSNQQLHQTGVAASDRAGSSTGFKASGLLKRR